MYDVFRMFLLSDTVFLLMVLNKCDVLLYLLFTCKAIKVG